MEKGRGHIGTCSRRHAPRTKPKPFHRQKKTASGGDNIQNSHVSNGVKGPPKAPSREHSSCRSSGDTPIDGGVDGGSPSLSGYEDKYSVFPSYSIWVVWAGILAFRIYLISRRDSAWVLHPDEVFQSVEVSHSMVYGYGFRPYEYLPPPDPNSSLVVERQEAATGMYSLRSFLYPHLFALVLWLAETVGVAGNPFQTFRLFHAGVAAHLPVSVYLFTRSWLTALGTSPGERRDVSVLCSVLVALSQQLTVLGTHSLINSFLAPLTFLATALFIRVLIGGNNVDRTPSESGGELFDSLRHSDDSGISSDNESHVDHISERTEKQTDSNTDDKFYDVHGRCSNSNQCNGYSSAAISSYKLWNTQVYIHGVSFVFIQLITNSVKWTTGMMFGLLIYIRPDQVLIISTICLSIIASVFTRNGLSAIARTLMHVTFGAVTGIFVGGYQDHKTYGTWFLSPYQWFSFNVRRGMSSTLFGSQDLCFYVSEIFLKNNPMTINLLLVVLTSLFYAWRWLTTTKNSKDVKSLRILPYIGIPFLTLISIYSLQQHKELRFVHNLLVLFHIMLGVNLYRLLRHITEIRLRSIATLSTLLFFAFNLYTSLALPGNKSNVDWAYLQHWDSNHINDCLRYVGRQPDSTGVFLDRSVHISGGYSVLHKNIPIFSLVHYEFQEFGLSSQTPVADRAWLSTAPVRVSKLNRVSNFVTAENSPLLLKYLIAQREYNYLVVKRQREVISVGFQEVFTSGTMRVLRRTYDERSESELRQIADSIPLGSNATVLEYEGSWLHTLGLYQLAVERLLYSMRLNQAPRVRVFQLLTMCYNGLGQRERAREVYERCLHTYGDTCARPQSKIILHSDYDLDIQT